MNVRKKLEAKIKRKEQEIQGLEAKVNDAKIYIQALNDTLKFLPKDKGEVILAADKLRAGSLVFKTWEYLKKAGKPVHINKILPAIGKTTSKNDKIALAGSLGWYVRRHEIFTRPAPNTFGLDSMENNSDDEVPDDFGLENNDNLEDTTEDIEEETTDLEPF